MALETPSRNPQSASRDQETRPRRVRLSREISFYLVRGILLYFCVSFLILEAVWGTILTVRVTERYNLDFLIILPVLLSALGESLTYTVPVSLLFGSALLVGRLRAERELLAMNSFGIAPGQLLCAVTIFGAIFAGFSYEVSQRWVPHFRHQTRNVASFMMDQLPYLGEGWNLDFDLDPYLIWVYRHDGPLLEGIFLTSVVDNKKDGKKDDKSPISKDALEGVENPTYPFYMFAERAMIGRKSETDGSFAIRFENVSLFLDDDFFSKSKDSESSSDFIQRGQMSSWTWSLPVTGRSRKAKEKDRWQLHEDTPIFYERWQEDQKKGVPRATKKSKEAYHAHLSEPHRRLAVALSCLTFPLAAFAIGLWLRSNNRLLPFFAASTVVPGIYFSVEIMTSKWAIDDGIVPWATLQIGNVALLILTVVLYWRTIQGPKRR